MVQHCVSLICKVRVLGPYATQARTGLPQLCGRQLCCLGSPFRVYVCVCVCAHVYVYVAEAGLYLGIVVSGGGRGQQGSRINMAAKLLSQI